MNQGLADKYVNELATTHNEFKTTQDRKYAIYTIFRYHKEPFSVMKLCGSNQVLLYDNDNKLIYDSDFETQEQQDNFREWIKKQIIILLLCILPDGLE